MNGTQLRKDQFDPQSGFDADVRRKLLASSQKRVASGHLFRPNAGDINRSYPVRFNRSGSDAGGVPVREFNRILKLITKFFG